MRGRFARYTRWMSEFEALTLKAGPLSFSAHAAGAGPIVLLVHGFPDHAHSWRFQLPVLAEAGYRAVAPTLRGYEPSSQPADADYHIVRMAEDVVAWIDDLGGEPVHLVGHDWGAIIAYAAAMMVAGIPIALYQLLSADNYAKAQAIAFGVHSSAYALVAIGFLASVLIEYQQHLSHLATEDPLTRLLNRRGLEGALYISLAHASRQELTTSAIMVDIDHFKKVNDSFGHEVGDNVIKQVAEFLQRMSRASDVVARTGGEEYLLVLPDTGLDAARILAERIRVAIAERPMVVDHQRISITVSLGVASVVGEVDLDALSREADRAMYLAKRGGRNRVASVENNPVHLSTAASQA